MKKIELAKLTDSYKVTHWNMLPSNTTNIHSYFEARNGAKYPKTMFYGLRYIIKKYLTDIISDCCLDNVFFESHMGEGSFNLKGWGILQRDYINRGALPIRIKAVPEGTLVDNSNVLMTVEATDERFVWLGQYLETILTHVWGPSTVATKTFFFRKMLIDYLKETTDYDDETIKNISAFQLHDFGFRGASSLESAALLGSGHLVNFKGTDTIPAICLINKYYGVDDYDTAFSVPASEHSVMTALGEEGEIEVMRSLISKYPKGILSVVSDSYNIVRNVTEYLKILKDDILNRTKNSVGVCKYVVRPDSLRWENDTPEDQMLFIYKSLADIFGYTVNNKGHEVLNPKVGIIWGDGIDDEGCRKILEIFKQNKISTECLVFGMGGGLLQKISRDTQRFAFKCSARTDDQGNVINIQKNPMDSSKKSKSGLLKLIKNDDGTFQTVDRRDPLYINRKDELVTVFYQAECNGYINNFDKIRERAVVAL